MITHATVHLIGYRDTGSVVPPARQQGLGPLAEAVRFRRRVPQHRAGAVDVKCSKIRIAALADPQQDGLTARRMLARHQVFRDVDYFSLRKYPGYISAI